MGFADFPFQSRYRTVRGHRLHYIDEGQGPVLVFLHGNPTSSYLWRNVIKPLSSHYRCIALDLIGFGKSDKPDLDYRFLTHYNFVEGFVQALKLKDMTLVLHDWGGPLGFRLAQRHPDLVSGICFMETFPFTMNWKDLPGPARPLFRAFRHPLAGKALILWQNLFVNLVLPWSVKRHLPRSVKEAYRAPFRRVRDRFPIYVWPNELPLEERRDDTWAALRQIEDGLAEMPQRMLLLRFRPGAIIRRYRARWLERRLPHLTVVDCGPGLHFVQEDQPESIAANLGAWLEERLPRQRHPREADIPAGPAGLDAAVTEDTGFRGELYWRRLEHDGDSMVAAWSDAGLAMLQFIDSGDDPEELVRDLFPEATPRHQPDDETDWLAPAAPLHLIGTDFQRRVWRALMAVPEGETRTYKALAEELDSQPRAVGQAVARNAIALRVPCHRVVPVSGGPGQYRWGRERKARLLAREGAV